MIKIKPDSLNNLKKVSAADCFQVRSISEQRFVKYLGKVDEDILQLIKYGLAKVFSIDI